jgi:hypothetical protein
MFVRGRAPRKIVPRRRPLHHGDRYAREDAGRLIIGERDGDMPQARRTAPGPRWPSAPLGSQSKPTSFQSGGPYLAYRSLFQLKFELLQLFTLPSVSHRDLVRLVRTFLRTPLEVTVSRDNCLTIAFFELVGQRRRTGRKVCV